MEFDDNSGKPRMCDATPRRDADAANRTCKVRWLLENEKTGLRPSLAATSKTRVDCDSRHVLPMRVTAKCFLTCPGLEQTYEEAAKVQLVEGRAA